jgi:CheY-like chemotaxis protein
MEQPRLNILLIDDDESAAALFRLMVEKAGCPVRLIVAEGAQKAMDYLSGAGPYSNRAAHPMPDLVVLDLIMPGLSGFDILHWRQQMPQLRLVPVVVFSGSMREHDREKALANGAARFLQKPMDLEQLKAVVAEILDFAADHVHSG